MDKKEFLEGIDKLEYAYNTKFENEKLKIWYDALKDMNFNTYITRIDKLIKTNKYLPNIAEISDKKTDLGYEQRDYTGYDFNKLYANFEKEESL